MAGTTENSTKPTRQVLGGLENEDIDFENMVQRMLDADFEDWPNEAGVSLHLPDFIPESVLTTISSLRA